MASFAAPHGVKRRRSATGNVWGEIMYHPRKYMGLWAVIGILASAASVWGDGYRNPPDGALALGRIGGRVVDIDDASAVSHNPANLAELGDLSIQASATFGYASKRFTDLRGNRTETEDPWRALPSAYAAVPLKPGVATMGVGINVPYGQSTRWDENGPLRYTAPFYARMTVADVSAAVGVRLTDRVAVGAGVDIYRGDIKFEQFVPWSMIAQNAALPDGIMRFTGDGYALGGKAGVTVKITESQRAALTYKLPFDVDYEGDFKLSNIPGGVPAAGVSDFSTRIKYPGIVAAGYSVRVTEAVRLEANVEWLEHSRNRYMALDAGANNALLNALGTSSIAQDWRNTWTFGLGGDWQFARNWKARAGFVHMPTPVPRHTLMPSAAEEDHSVVSVGLGYRRSQHAMDLAAAQGLFRGRKVRGNQNSDYDGDYDFKSTLMGISYQYSF